TPEDVAFATKPALATEMIIRALDAGTPAGWVAGDEVYARTRSCAPSWPAAGWATSWPDHQHPRPGSR
ncbi:MAG: hypothetical protein QOG95_3504, partial [Mycobacterium sp.]|nr:hypothetical protein [Mycobacterium sp.]